MSLTFTVSNEYSSLQSTHCNRYAHWCATVIRGFATNRYQFFIRLDTQCNTASVSLPLRLRLHFAFCALPLSMGSCHCRCLGYARYRSVMTLSLCTVLAKKCLCTLPPSAVHLPCALSHGPSFHCAYEALSLTQACHSLDVAISHRPGVVSLLHCPWTLQCVI